MRPGSRPDLQQGGRQVAVGAVLLEKPVDLVIRQAIRRCGSGIGVRSLAGYPAAEYNGRREPAASAAGLAAATRRGASIGSVRSESVSLRKCHRMAWRNSSRLPASARGDHAGNVQSAPARGSASGSCSTRSPRKSEWKRIAQRGGSRPRARGGRLSPRLPFLRSSAAPWTAMRSVRPTRSARPNRCRHISRVVGEVPMGRAAGLTVALGEAALIHTGGMLPDGSRRGGDARADPAPRLLRTSKCCARSPRARTPWASARM